MRSIKRPLQALLLVLALCLAVALSSAALADEAGSGWLFAACYDESGVYAGVKVFPGEATVLDLGEAASVKLIRTDTDLIPSGEAPLLPVRYNTVRKIGEQVCLCCDVPGGVTLTRPVTDKLTARVRHHDSGGMTIKDQRYAFSALPAEDCPVDIAEAAAWGWSDRRGVYDFYLDPDGAICWAEALDADDMDPDQTCLVLSASADDGRLQALLLFQDGTSETVDISKLDRKAVTAETAEAALDKLQLRTGVYNWKSAEAGYALLAMDADTGLWEWDDPVVLGGGREIAASVHPQSKFACRPIDLAGQYPLDTQLYANSQTIFVAFQTPGDGSVNCGVYQGFKSLPKLLVKRIIAAVCRDEHGASGLGGYVFLETDQLPPAPSEVEAAALLSGRPAG